MSRVFPRPATLAVLVALPLACGSAATARAAGPHSPAECEVWARESSFAKSVADHDAEAFAEHVHPGAVFGAGGDRQRRGREAVVRAWASIVEGKQLTIEWYPTRTTIGGEGDIAWSQGPALIVVDPGTERTEYRLGGFHSVWHHGGDGVWRVLFDDGIESVTATPEQIRAFREGRREACPAG